MFSHPDIIALCFILEKIDFGETASNYQIQYQRGENAG